MAPKSRKSKSSPAKASNKAPETLWDRILETLSKEDGQWSGNLVEIFLNHLGSAGPILLQADGQRLLQSPTLLSAPGFVDDAEFISLNIVRLVLKSVVAAPAGALSSLGGKLVEKALTDAKIGAEQVKAAHKALLTLFEDVIGKKISAGATASGSDKGAEMLGDTSIPRVLRVCQRLRLSDAETEAMVYIVASHSTGVFTQPGASLHSMLIPATVAQVAGMSSFELMNFLADSRRHIKQGLLGLSDQKTKGLVMEARVTMPHEVVAALTGVKLTIEELVKLDKTALADVMMAESGNEGLPASINQHRTKSGGGDADGEEGDEEDEDEGEDSDEETATRRQKRGREDEEGAGGEAGPELTESALLKPGSPTSELNGASPLLTASLANAAGSDGTFKPYTSDIEYAEDYFKLLTARIKQRYAEGDMKDEEEAYYNPKNKAEASVREYTGKQRLMRTTMAARLRATAASNSNGKTTSPPPPATTTTTSYPPNVPAGGSYYPKIETLSNQLKLSQFEKDLVMLMVGSVISHDILIAINGRHVMRGDGQRELTVGFVLFVLCDGLQDRVAARKSFRQSAALIDKALISCSIATQGRHTFNTDLMDYMVDIDRKVVDLIMGLKTGTGEMVQNSTLYRPTVNCKAVVLPQETKEKVLSTIEHYELFAKAKKKSGFGEGLGSQAGGLVFLFHGPSGTGKTMLANGIANELGKQVLLVNLSQLKAEGRAGDILRFVFREAKLNDAIIFFDECESFFESRESNPLVTSALAQFERYDGIIIMATNRAQIIDEAMNRRISLMVEFRLPDHSMREEIWRAHLPETIKLADNVNVTALALGFELSGGLIKNAALAALSLAVARDKSEEPVVRQEDLIAGAKSQLRGFFQTNEGQKTGAAQYITPKRALSEMVLEKNISNQLTNIVKMAKSRNTLFTKWGFEEHEFGDESQLCLFSGLSGTGKSMAAEGIALDCGSTIRCMNVSEMFLKREVSVETIFEEGRKLGAIIVFDAAQALFDHSERSQNVADLIQYHSKGYPKPVIIIATTSPSQPSIDVQCCGLRIANEVHFQLPSKNLRELLWKRTIPDKVPLAEDVDFKALAEKQVSAKFIRSVAFNACSKTSLLPEVTKNSETGAEVPRKVTQKMLLDELESQLRKQERLNPHFGMFV